MPAVLWLVVFFKEISDGGKTLHFLIGRFFSKIFLIGGKTLDRQVTSFRGGQVCFVGETEK